MLDRLQVFQSLLGFFSHHWITRSDQFSQGGQFIRKSWWAECFTELPCLVQYLWLSCCPSS